jgi:hypothetical protein
MSVQFGFSERNLAADKARNERWPDSSPTGAETDMGALVPTIPSSISARLVAARAPCWPTSPCPTWLSSSSHGAWPTRDVRRVSNSVICAFRRSSSSSPPLLWRLVCTIKTARKQLQKRAP